MTSVRFDMAKATWGLFEDSERYICKSCVCWFSTSLVEVEGRKKETEIRGSGECDLAGEEATQSVKI